MKKITTTLIVATSQNNVIGKGNDLPWHLPRDLQYFKKVTTGCPIIMGRKTYESIGKALPNRLNVVVTRNRDYQLSDAEVIYNLSDAITLAKTQQPDAREIHIIGGATIFEQALAESLIDKLYINHVRWLFDGDTFLPEINWAQWELIHEEHHEADADNAYVLDFEVYKRIGSTATQPTTSLKSRLLNWLQSKIFPQNSIQNQTENPS